MRPDIGILLWATLLPRWRHRDVDGAPGYALLVPVPGDLPVFAKLALDVCRRQAARDRVQTLVISDLPSPAVRNLVTEAKPSWPGLDYVAPSALLSRVLRTLNDPGRYHGVQLILGTDHARATHVLLHDADAILLDTTFLDAQYVVARERGLAALGVHPLWDESLRQRRPELVATWEMCAERSWLTSVPPFRHIAHAITVDGAAHVADTTVYAQLATPPERLGLHGGESRFVHFNYVISTYRRWQRGRDKHFVDDAFRLLLIRVLTDVLGAGDRNTGQLPTLKDLARGLSTPTSPVAYPSADGAAPADYGTFREKLTRGLVGIYGADSAPVRRLPQALAPFDDHYQAH